MARPHSETTELLLSPQSSTSATLHEDRAQIVEGNRKRKAGCSFFTGLKWLASCLLAPYNNFFDAMGQVNQYEGNLCRPMKRTYNLSRSDTKRLVEELNKEAGIRATLVRSMHLGAEERDLERGDYGTMDPAVERWRSEVHIELESLVSDDEELTDSE
ncbi:hypothetical protein CKM354_000976300 [Cercospora kikuchii]|uniref:Uncharacterized protein n=1 Tax=Cercospora kikuchii TaxID=84275 RepID=A0A9P3CLG6_9PEZI|nr:uncharacterized protein CKM354_000976300 [Cercospora kikuchii]GIZ46644.1 hypothetical protein CKM354_000976300 [Cercospora kikuchii]